MRSGITLNLASTTTKTTFSPPSAMVQRSPWHSPVPYLFGGLAAMIGLIVFALLILACSYWNLSNRRRSQEGSWDIEIGDYPAEFEEKIVVIMAGDVNPTYLATPLSNSRSSSFGKVEKKVGQPNETAPENTSTQETETETGGSLQS